MEWRDPSPLWQPMTEPSPAFLPLAADFPPATREQWLDLVAGLLKGAPFERRLVAKTRDGLEIQPLYPATAEERSPLGRGAGGPWAILQRLDHPHPEAANAEARHDCENGASGLSLVLAGAVGAYGFGIAPNQAPIARALAGLPLGVPGTALEVDAGAHGEEASRAIAALAEQRDIAAGAIRFGLDPLGAMAMSGAAPVPWKDAAALLGRRIAALAQAGFKGPFAVADGRVIHNAGGSEAQELGFSLAVAVAYLRALEQNGVALDAARSMIFFRLSADADQFLTIAKFRALRRLWARVEESCGLKPAPIFISAETAWRMMTARDPYVNMLRATIAVFSAGLGGADAVTVLPFTLARGLPDRFARRIARNTQLVLTAESNLAKVSDPAAGAGVVEDLTDQLCASAWGWFQDIERAGGAAAALEQGLIQGKVAAVRSERESALARRTETLTGTSDFADLDETTVAVLDVAPSAPAPSQGATFAPLPSIRLAAPYEALRDASDRTLALNGARPKIFLANLGALADFTTRANFARNFFAAGGIAAVTNDGFARSSPAAGETDLAALVAAFKAAGTDLACLCGSDETYARQAIPVAKALAAAGAAHIYYAGRPAQAAELTAAGIEHFIHVGCDTLVVLRAVHQQIKGDQQLL
jgi:methylmalonyl-CoA mutase